MSNFARRLVLGSLLGMGLVLVAGTGTAQAGLNEDLVKLIKDAGGGPVPKAKLEGIKKKYDLEETMQIYKHRAKGGLGFGPASKADGLEAKLIGLGKKPLAEGQLKKEADELIRMAQINAAIAEIAVLHPAPKATVPGKGPKDWKEYSETMKESSLAFLKAVKAGNPSAVRKASDNLNNACITCHNDFR